MRPSVVGAITLAGAALAVVGALAIARGPGQPARLHPLLLASASGVREGGLVLYRGLEVGRIRTVALTDTGVLVTLGIERADLVLRASDSARVATQGLLGDKVVDILPGDHHAAPILAGAALPVRPSPFESDLFAQFMRDLAACRDTTGRRAGDSASRAAAAPAAVQKRDT